MTPMLEARAEILKLARVLGCEPRALAYLEKVPPDDIRRVREYATDTLFDADRERLARIAWASRLLPSQLVASIGERVFGALLCARITGLLEPSRAVAVARRLPAPFLAEIAVELDPRRASEVIARTPADRVAEVARELLRRGEHVAMGRFVAYLSDEALAACIEVIDDASLLRIMFVLEGKEERLDHLVGLLPQDRLAGIIRAAAVEGLWAETLDLLGSVGDRRTEQLAELAARQDDAVLDGMVRAAQDQRLWDAVLPIAVRMRESSRRRFSGIASIQDEDVLAAVVRAAARQSLWNELLPLVTLLPRDSQRRVAAAASTLARPVFQRVIEDAVASPGLRRAVLVLLAEMDGAGRRRVVEVLNGMDPAHRKLLRDLIRDLGDGEGLGPLRSALGLPDPGRGA